MLYITVFKADSLLGPIFQIVSHKVIAMRT